ncbi:MAG: efflux RND transporter permease subunit [Calditrichia bacterium]
MDGTRCICASFADVTIGGAIRRGVQTRNGAEEVVSGMVVKLCGTNSSTVIGAVEAKMAEINNILPEGVRIVPYYERKRWLKPASKP